MIISTNWLKKYTDVDGSIEELAELIGSRLVEIEEVIELGAKYKDVRIVRVVACEKLENSDHLNVTRIDDGGVVEGVERDENGYVQVVCGAPNVHAGMLAAWLPPKSTVPSSLASDPFVLDSRKLRGVMSHGMLASATELDLFDDHSGILEITEDHAAGESFAKAYELNDHLFDIENKSLTHRPDCFGVIGFAREVAAIQGKRFETPGWLQEFETQKGRFAEAAPKVTIENAELSPRYQAVLIGGELASTASPLYVQTYLARCGMRPVNAVVDMTNYLMLLSGQPLHAFDYDKVCRIAGDAPMISVRAGKNEEKLTLLDGREITLTPEDIVVAANDVPVALAGAMGGAATEVDESTTTILLESASFDLFHLRTTQMRHGIFSEAITRFTKGQAPEQTAPVLRQAVALLREWVGATQLSPVGEAFPRPTVRQEILVPIAKVNAVLGTSDSVMAMRATLENVEFDVRVEPIDGEQTLIARPPYWRSDIHIAEDIIEEIGRINAYDDIEPSLPTRRFVAVRPSELDQTKSRIRDLLVRAGANEVLTYSFVHGDVLRRAGQDPSASYKLTNSISPDLQYYRQSLTPSLLGCINANSRAGFDEFAVFELNKVHSKTLPETSENVPAEVPMVALSYASKNGNGHAFYTAKKYVLYLLEGLGIAARIEPLDGETNDAYTAPFEPRQSGRVVNIVSGTLLGIVGEYTASARKNFKLPARSAGFELFSEALSTASTQVRPYQPLSRYPGTSRDICFKVDDAVSYDEVTAPIEVYLAKLPLQTALSPVDIYKADASDTKNITVRLSFVSLDKTLESDEVNAYVDEIVAVTHAATGAVVV